MMASAAGQPLEAVTFGYPRVRSFWTAGLSRPLAIRDWRRC